MQIIYFPGYSTKNIDEGENIVNILIENNYSVFFNRWRHWNEEIQTSREIEEDISSILNNFGNETEFGIIGKSIGTIAGVNLANRLIENVKIVKFLILLGIPVGEISDKEKEENKDLLGKFDFPVFVIQNNKDEHGNEEQIKKFLEGVECRLVIKEADNHRYNYPEDILAIIDSVSLQERDR